MQGQPSSGGILICGAGPASSVEVLSRLLFIYNLSFCFISFAAKYGLYGMLDIGVNLCVIVKSLY